MADLTMNLGKHGAGITNQVGLDFQSKSQSMRIANFDDPPNLIDGLRQIRIGVFGLRMIERKSADQLRIESARRSDPTLRALIASPVAPREG